MTASAIAAGISFTHGNPMVNGTSAGANSNAESSTISANDFLTLLVTEMKNQDPTAQTDPNQYVNQLVQVNSLQQLIEINQNLSSALGDSSSSAKAIRSGTPASAEQRMGGVPDTSAGTGGTGTKGTNSPIAMSASPIRAVAGSLGISNTNPAAQRVAHALSGRK